MKLTTIYSHLRNDMSNIEKDLEKTIEAQHSILQDASQQLLKAGGNEFALFLCFCLHNSEKMIPNG